MLLDAHSHLDKYDDRLIGKAIEEIKSHEIFMVSVAMDLESYKRNILIASRSRFIVPAFGIHPWNASEFDGKMDELIPLIEQSAMLGEIGLDYHFVEDVSRYPAQRHVFEHFLQAAHSQNKIINLHTKGAENEVLSMLELCQIRRAIIHWYSGPLEVLEKYIEKGYYLTIGVEILFSDHIREICRMIPDNLLLTETDNPGGYEWLTKEKGMPSIIERVTAAIADVKNSSAAEVEALVWRNFKTLIEEDPHLHLDQSIIN